MRNHFSCRAIAATLLLHASGVGAQLAVTAPNGASTAIAAGDDYATQILGNAWDMDRAADVQTPESIDLSSQSVSGGIYSAMAQDLNGDTVVDPYFYMAFQGITSSVANNNGTRFPVDTARYRYVTFKMRLSGGGISGGQSTHVFWYRNRDSISNFTFGCTSFVSITAGQWQIVTIDLLNNFTAAQCTGNGANTSNDQWRDGITQQGLRIDPVAFPGGGAGSGVLVQVDWVRLTSESVATNQRFNVTWTDNTSGSPYTVTAIETGANPARFTLGSNIAGSARSFNADLSRLPPGNYNIEVSRSGATATSSAPLMINRPPEFVVTAPSERGDQARNYAIVERGQQWGPLEAGDVTLTENLVNVAYSGGVLTARHANDDPTILFNTGFAPGQTTGGTSIDTSRYRSLCFTLQVQGVRDVGTGSVARVKWGNNPATLASTDDIIVEEGLNEYCFSDIGALPLEGANQQPWSGAYNFIRFDPHEFPVPAPCNSNPTPLNCRDIRVDSFVLSPYFQANPNFTFTWNLADPDNASSTVQIFLDPDRNPGSGNETLVTSQSAATGNGQFAWSVPGGVAPGLYNVYLSFNDGINSVTRYASGPLIVGVGQSTQITIAAPATDTNLPAAADFARDVLTNRFDMADAADINVARSSNLSSQGFSNGIYSAQSTSIDPSVFLVHPADDAAIPTANYRTLTAKVRLNGTGTHFIQALWFTDPNLVAPSLGFTVGKPVTAGSWQIVTLDLVNERDGSSPTTWTQVPNMPALRLDPTNVAAAGIEIDWITLTGAANPAAQYTIQWTSQNLTASTFDVVLIDPDGAEIPVAAGLPPGSTSAGFNPSRFGPDAYNVRVRATPGPTTVSTARLVVGDVPTVSPFNILTNGFE
jgi:hypothetical protein